jgi:hypothetical protein
VVLIDLSMRTNKFLLVLIVGLSFYSCRNEKSGSASQDEKKKNYPVLKQVTFNLRDPAIQKNILLDTISIEAKDGHANLYIVFPILPVKEYPGISKWVDRLVLNKKREFSEEVKTDPEIYDTTSGITDGWDMYIRPRLLYKTDSLLSFSIEDGGGARGMPAGFKYQVINFDFKREKEITLKDYFTFKTHADSLFLENLITRVIGHEFLLRNYLGANGKIDFAFDNNAVYFLFDKYDSMGWGILSVEKKYILNHINPVYR